MRDLIIGISLMLGSAGIFVLCMPRNGKTAWFVGKPFLAPFVTVVLVAGLAIGVLFIAAHFTTIDDMTLSG